MDKSRELLNEVIDELELLEINGGSLIGDIIGNIAGGCSWGNMFVPDKGHNTTVPCVPR